MLEEAEPITRSRGRNEIVYQIKKCHGDTSRSATVTPAQYIRTVNRTNIGTTNNQETPRRFQKSHSETPEVRRGDLYKSAVETSRGPWRGLTLH
jgi:hypothetical protein